MGDHSLEEAAELQPRPNVLNIRSKNDVVLLAYFALPLVSTALVSYGAATQETATLWAGVATGVLQLIFQYARTEDYLRKAIYTSLNLLNIILVAYVAGFNPHALESIQPILTLLLGGSAAAIAGQNVNTTGTRQVGA